MFVAAVAAAVAAAAAAVVVTRDGIIRGFCRLPRTGCRSNNKTRFFFLQKRGKPRAGVYLFLCLFVSVF